MANSKIFKRGAFIAAALLLIICCVAVPSIRSAFSNIAYAIEGRVITYFNDIVANDGVGGNDWNFGPDRKAQAEEAIANGEADSVQDYVYKKGTDEEESTGDFLYSISVDPALCAAIALDMDEKLALPETILIDEQNVVIGQRADEAHKHFLADQEYWDRAQEMIREYLDTADIKIEHLSNYTSAMYMWNNHLDGNKPSVIVRNTVNAGGDVVIFDLGKPGIVKYRLQCGYQPIDVGYWPTPDQPPVPDNPEPDDPTPELEPKDPNAGPQSQGKDQPGYEDFGGGQNHDNDTTITEEPKNPDSYTAPEPPKADDSTKNNDSNKKPADGSAGTQSGSKTVDEDNGKTENRGGKDYQVVAGDGEQHSDLNKVQEEQHNSSTVEEPLKDDGVNQGDLDPANIE